MDFADAFRATRQTGFLTEIWTRRDLELDPVKQESDPDGLGFRGEV